MKYHELKSTYHMEKCKNIYFSNNFESKGYKKKNNSMLNITEMKAVNTSED